MERGLSFDDLMDGIHKLTSAGFPRNDSEALFQDFIRRIPSSGNLSASDGLNYLDPAQQAQLQQSVQQFQQQAQQHSAGNDAVLRSTSSNDLQEVGGLEVKNFPRVASLDYLQHLVQQSAASQSVKPPAPAPDATPSDTQSSPPMSGVSQDGPVPSTIPTMPLLTTQPKPPIPVSVPTNPHTLAAALQLGQLTSMQLARTVGHDQAESPGNAKAEVRRARRMLSNRESARRSRRRKQEHLSTMEEQLIMCQEDKQKLEDEHLRIVSEADQLRQENALLRRELDECQRQMRAAGMEVARGKADTGDHTHTAKKLCNGNRESKPPRGAAKQAGAGSHPKREPELEF